MLGACGRYHVARQFHAAQLPESAPVNIGPAVVVDQHRRVDILNIIRLRHPLRDDRSGGMRVAPGAERRIGDPDADCEAVFRAAGLPDYRGTEIQAPVAAPAPLSLPD